MSTLTLNARIPAQRRALATVHTLRAPSAPRVASGPARSTGGVRLTRRGRVVVFLAAMALVLLAGVFLGTSGAVGTEEAGAPAPTEIVMVGQGDTLWGIASEIAEDGGEVRTVMNEIERLNALESGMLTLGQKLRVPAGE